MTHCIAYIRQSDEEGKKKELSCPSQEQRFHVDRAAEESRIGAQITYDIAPWDEGKSGGDMDREGLQWVLSRLDSCQMIWVYDPDRLVRHPFFAPYIMNELRNRSIVLWGPWGREEPTPMGRFMIDTRMRFGAYYREEVAEHTKQNRDSRLRDGLWSGHPPTGYMFVDEKGPGSRRILVPDPEAAPKVQAVFGMLAAGESQREACRQLGFSQTNVIWQKGNPLYIGLVYKLRENVNALETRTHAALWALAEDPEIDWIYPGRQEPLIDAVVWDAVELRRQTSPRTIVSRVYGLSGRIRCDTCGSVLRVAPNVGKRKPSLRCENCMWERYYRYAENAILVALAYVAESATFEAAVEAEVVREKKPEADKLKPMVTERAKVVRQLDRALDLLMDSDEISQAVRERAVALKKRRDELDGLIAQEKARNAGKATTVKAWRAARGDLATAPVERFWAVASPEERRTTLMRTFSSIRATRAHLTFEVRGLEMTFQIRWLKQNVHDSEVAGPGRERVMDIFGAVAFLGRVC